MGFQDESLVLVSPTPERWIEKVVGRFDAFLQDHAACERKAAALAMSFVAKYSDRPQLVEPMISLAREELQHFRQVFHLLQRRGVGLAASDEKDQYVNGILKKLRHGQNERLLDRLITSGLIECRGYERFSLLAQHLEDEELKQFYHQLAKSEAGHYKIFCRLARLYFTENEVSEALERIANIESEEMLACELTHRLH